MKKAAQARLNAVQSELSYIEGQTSTAKLAMFVLTLLLAVCLYITLKGGPDVVMRELQLMQQGTKTLDGMIANAEASQK